MSQIGGDKALGRHAQGVERKEYGAAQGACAHGGEGYGGTHGGAGEHRQRSLSPLKSRGVRQTLVSTGGRPSGRQKQRQGGDQHHAPDHR